MKLKKIILLGFFSITALLLRSFSLGPAFAQNEIIQQMIEDGEVSPAVKLFNGFTTKLLCQGAVQCGSVLYMNIAIDPASDNSKILFTADTLIIMGTSRLIVHNCLFVANSLTGFVDPEDSNSGNTPFAIFMSKHDPINPGEGTGRFAEATKLDYRGMVEFHDLNSFFVNSRESSCAISK
jgi:hypothetical protein